MQDLSGGALAVGSRSEVLSTHFGGAVRFTAAVSALKWAYQPMVVTAAPAAADAVRLLCPHKTLNHALPSQDSKAFFALARL